MSAPFGKSPKLREYIEGARSEGRCQVHEGVTGTRPMFHFKGPNGHAYITGLLDSETLSHSQVANLDRRLGVGSPFPKTPQPCRQTGSVGGVRSVCCGASRPPYVCPPPIDLQQQGNPLIALGRDTALTFSLRVMPGKFRGMPGDLVEAPDEGHERIVQHRSRPLRDGIAGREVRRGGPGRG